MKWKKWLENENSVAVSKKEIERNPYDTVEQDIVEQENKKNEEIIANFNLPVIENNNIEIISNMLVKKNIDVEIIPNILVINKTEKYVNIKISLLFAIH